MFEKLSLFAFIRPGLKVGANRTKSTEGTDSQSGSSFQSVSTDFARLAPTSSPGRDSNESEEAFYKTSPKVQ